ncbi:MAG: acetate--CoA ligase family protein [Syntrophales bacterium]|nr:acetate--CoA ligase family protein [Syntrophales bacterium]MDD4338284.1 acetate--CoA ligase family protein [Syntrophales bacterium]HOG08236.1 acetate--CoA ligase family protein [Syntrophales bacterium]HPB70270.1 acetate--CoA ligase family protein [Syntrophales bacterium]HQP28709.1 acetate--CoA ligase family protein [Syntrophales bacterium]
MSDIHDDCIRYLFEPRSVAVIGASHERAKIGSAVLANIVSGGYTGRILPVNPAGGVIEGRPVYPRVADIEGEVDLAIIAIPAKFVFDAVCQCADRGVKYGIIITSGFSEIGNRQEENRIIDYANGHGMRIVGPNVFGVYSSAVNLNATFVDGNISSGHLAMITQSGALGLTMIGQAEVENIGMSAIVSVGNKADIDEADLLQYLARHNDTRVILIYIEGIRNGEKLVRILKQAARLKPVVIIKSGRSSRGAMAAASHTGSLAGADDVFDAIIRQCGALRAESTSEAFAWSKFLADSPLPAGENAVIITNGGGAGVMATDAFEKFGLGMLDDAQLLKDVFTSATPSFGSTRNPIDITGQATAQDYTRAFDAALKCPEIHSVLGVYCESALFSSDNLKEAIEDNYRRFKAAGKPIIFSLFGGEKTSTYVASARRRGIPVSDDVYPAAASLGAMYAYHRYLHEPPEAIADATIDVEAIDRIVADVRREGRYFLLSHEARTIMTLAGIAIPNSLTAQNLDGAIRSADQIGYPVVMKIVSRDIIHKSDAGGIALDLDNADEVMDAYGAIMRNCRTSVPHAVLEGVEISEMVRPGTEMIVGARIDRAFGPILMVGLGGIYVEVMKDVSFRSLPLERKEILGMIKSIRSYPLLLGVRGEETKDIDSLVDTMIKLGAIIQKCRGVSDIEINPLVVYEQGSGTRAVDVRIILSNG